MKPGGVVPIFTKQPGTAARRAGRDDRGRRAFVEGREIKGHRQILTFGIAIDDLESEGTSTGSAPGDQEASSGAIDRRHRTHPEVAAAMDRSSGFRGDSNQRSGRETFSIPRRKAGEDEIEHFGRRSAAESSDGATIDLGHHERGPDGPAGMSDDRGGVDPSFDHHSNGARIQHPVVGDQDIRAGLAASGYQSTHQRSSSGDRGLEGHRQGGGACGEGVGEDHDQFRWGSRLEPTSNDAARPDVGGTIPVVEHETPRSYSRTGDREGCQGGSAVHLIASGKDTGRGDGHQGRGANRFSNGSCCFWKGGRMVITSDKKNH